MRFVIREEMIKNRYILDYKNKNKINSLIQVIIVTETRKH